MTLKELQTQVYNSVSLKGALKPLDFIQEDREISVVERLATYKTSSFLKSVSCLENDFLMTQKFLNLNNFEDFAKTYFLQSPPDTHYVNEIGRNFPEYIKKNKPQGTPGFIVDLAKLEWIMIECFYNFFDFRSPQKTNEKTERSIEANPSVQFFKSDWPIAKIWNDEVALEKNETTASVWATEDRSVHVESWNEIETHALKTLLESSTLDQAIDTMAKQYEIGELAEVFSFTLPRWVEMGLLQVSL